MKPIVALFIVTILAPAHAQQEPIAPAQSLPPAAPKGPKAPKDLERLEKQIEKTVEETLGPALEAGAQATANGLRLAQRAIAEAQLQDLHTYTLYSGPSSSSRGNRSLVITTSEPDPVANANAEEDLAIMSRILRKAIGSSQDERRMVMQIEVFGSASGARNMYLDGYGALFLLTVRYPLVAPTEKADDPKAKDNSSNEWKEARDEELQSSGRGGYGRDDESIRWANPGRTATEEFDGEKVDRLKTSLLESLKNATHIRALKPNDFVTVVVQGSEAIRVVESAKRKTTISFAGKPSPAPADSDGKGPGAAPSPKASSKTSRSRTSLGETVMTIRIKKSDADAFAQGKLDLDGFRKKAAIQAYFRKPTESTSANVFLPAR